MWVVAVTDTGVAISHVGSPREVLAYFGRTFPGCFPVIQHARTFCEGWWPYPYREEVPGEDRVLRALGLINRRYSRSWRFREDLRQVFGTEEGVVTSRVEGVTDPDYRWR